MKNQDIRSRHRILCSQIEISKKTARLYTHTHLRSILRKMKRVLISLIQKDNESLSQSQIWFLDNYYLIESEGKNILKAKDGFSPKVGELFDRILNLRDQKLEEDLLDGLFSCAAEENFWDESDFQRAKETCVFVLIRKIYLNLTRDENAIPHLITSLRHILTQDFSKLIKTYSPIERLFLQEPTGFYAQCSENTQNQYKNALKKKARKTKKTQIALLEEYLVLCQKQYAIDRDSKNAFIGWYLKKERHGFGYFPVLLSVFFLVLSAVFFAFYRLETFPIAFLTTLFCALPVFEAVRLILDFIYSILIRNRPIERLDIKYVPEEYKTLTVISALFSDKDDVTSLFDRLERIYLKNAQTGDNLQFGLLADFAEADEPVSKDDRKIFEAAKEKVNKLNQKYQNNFHLFLRSRIYSETSAKFMGYERKRGALCELTDFLFDRETSFAYYCGDKDNLKNIRYIVTLDADTNLGIAQIRELIGAMAHPLNRPEIELIRGVPVVTNGYGVLQPMMKPTLKSASRSMFSALVSGSAGQDVYSFAGFDTFQTLFERGVFCGKGIFDLDAFDKTVRFAFPDESILSHDILEGTRLRSGLLTDVYLTDETPSTVASWNKRSHRWIRGDVQSFPYSFSYIRDHYGKLIKNPATFFDRYILWNALKSWFVAPACVFSIILSLFLPTGISTTLLCITFLPLIIPFVLSLITTIINMRFQPVYRNYFSRVTSGFWQTFLMMFYRFSTLFTECKNVLDATVRTLYRMIFSRKKLLDWKTASQTDHLFRTSGLLYYYVNMIASVAAGILLIVFRDQTLLKLIGSSWIFSPLVCHLISLPIPKESSLSIKHKNQLKRYMRDMWGYFSDQVGENTHYLPPDHLVVSPAPRVVYRTSPTNIGLYLVCILCAADMRLISPKEMKQRLELSISSIEKLEKYNGHLFNWYDIKTLSVLDPRYISTVDSGNFITCLVTLREGLREYESESVSFLNLIERLDALEAQTDFTCLYKKERNLFSLGLRPGEYAEETCYDFYMSEARLTSFYGVARRIVDKKHWKTLSRTMVQKSMHFGAASWSGTAFEYFMPTLFLPIPQNSFSSESLKFAFTEQKKRCGILPDGKSVYGISESGFFSLDQTLGYEYKANGIPTLSVRREEDDLVISPYSSFLMLPIGNRGVMQNLARLKNVGIYGKYGFFEAVDFTPNRSENAFAPVYTYMAHHIGMSMIAAANAVNKNVFVKRFMSDPAMMCAAELLEEQIPVDAVVHRNLKDKGIHKKIIKKIDKTAHKETTPNPQNPKVYLHAAGELTLLCADRVQHKLQYRTDNGMISVTRPPLHGEDHSAGIIPLVLHEDQIYSPSPFFCDKSCEITHLNTPNACNHQIKTPDLRFECNTFLLSGASVLVAQTHIRRKQAICGFSLEPILENEHVYFAHPAFHGLFWHAKTLAEENAVLFYKRGENGAGLSICVTLIEKTKNLIQKTRQKGKDLSFSCIAGYENSKIGSEPAERIQNTFREISECTNFDRTVLSPLLLVRTRHAVEQASLIIAVGKTPQEAKGNLKTAKAILLNDRQLSLDQSRLQRFVNQNGRTLPYLQLFNRLEFYRFDTRKNAENESRYLRDALWRYGISGDRPILCVWLSAENKSETRKSALQTILSAYKASASFSTGCDLIFLSEDTEYYGDRTLSNLRTRLRKNGCEYLLHTSPGIRLIRIENETVRRQFLDCANVNLREADAFAVPDFSTLKSIRPEPILDSLAGLHEKENAFPMRCGTFTKDGYLVDKKVYRPLRPFSHILTNGTFSTLITDRSLGYTWYVNARENRLSYFQNDPYASFASEKIYRLYNGKYIDLLESASMVLFSCNFAEYRGKIEDEEYLVEVTVAKDRPDKRIRITMRSEMGQIIYRFIPILGEFVPKFGGVLIGKTADKRAHTLGFCGSNSMFHPQLYLYTDHDADCSYDGFLTLTINSKSSVEIVLSSQSTPPQTSFDTEKISAALFANTYLPHRPTPVNPTEIFSRFWLPYQTVMCRIFARSGFYQSGGAYGFRDQLQDAYCVRQLAPDLTKNIIIRASARQFMEGDCLHWWHPTPDASDTVCGSRTRCSDDYLFFVFCLCGYLLETGDIDILDISVPFVTGESLKEHEKEKYIRVYKSDKSATIREHADLCMRLLLSRGLGKHGFPPMGNCDWNDGMNRVGENGGESVWLGQFARIVIRKYLHLIGTNDTKLKDDLIAFSDRINHALCESYNGKYYPRAYFSTGDVIGNDPSITVSACAIDILPQAFAAFDYCRNSEKNEDERKRAISALNAAYENLFDKDNNLVMLFTPAFSDEKPSPGYISRYEKGLRENGGQYTHAAVWLARAFLKMGKECDDEELTEKGKNLIRAILPIRYAANKELADRYGGEPYVLAGDVYANESYRGRCGWSWYTGAAGWLYTTLREFDLLDMDFI